MSLDIGPMTRHDVDMLLGKTKKCTTCGADIPLMCTETIFGLCAKCRPYISNESLEDWLDELGNDVTEHNDKPVIAYVGRNIEATLSWARGLMSARKRRRSVKGKRKAAEARWQVNHAWTNLTYWAKKTEKKDGR